MRTPATPVVLSRPRSPPLPGGHDTTAATGGRLQAPPTAPTPSGRRRPSPPIAAVIGHPRGPMTRHTQIHRLAPAPLSLPALGAAACGESRAFVADYNDAVTSLRLTPATATRTTPRP